MEIPENLQSWYDKYLAAEAEGDELYEKSHNCREAYSSMRKVPEDAAKSLGGITDELRKTWFIDYGCMNGWNNKTSFMHAIAKCLHDIDKGLHPELHEEHSYEPYNCYHVNKCTCGLSDSCDSSG